MTEEKSHFIVGIGASAGGLNSIHHLFDNLPDNTGMSFVIIQHLSPDFKSLMPELLAKHTTMKIYTAEDNQVIKPNCIYLNQKNKNLHIKDHKLYLLDKGPRKHLNLPIDIFFHTLGEEYGSKAIGIILSGTGSDGSRGIKTIKEAGGTVLIQDPDTAQFDGMPNSAIATNMIDFVLPPHDISKWLLKQSMNRAGLFDLGDEENLAIINFKKVLDEVKTELGIDFSLYKRNTLQRRLEKRMQIHGVETLHEYLELLQRNDDEARILGQEFLIGVTNFFRDNEAFKALYLKVLPELVKNRSLDNPIRIWVAGCSSGEEVYSIAMMLDEFIKKQKLSVDFKIFATDVDTRAIEIAGNGIYPINNSTEISPFYLKNYFIKTASSIQIIKRIRDKIVFSRHDLLKDPPFIRVDMITCRNLLIYLNNDAQSKVFSSFQFALNKFGYLFLGNSESIGTLGEHFKTLDMKWKIFQSISDKKNVLPRYSKEERLSVLESSPFNQSGFFSKKFVRHPSGSESIFHEYLSKKFSPACLFIDRDYNIIFIKGNVGKHLSYTEGIFQNNLLKMVNNDLGSVIRNGVNKLTKDNQVVEIKGIVNQNREGAYTFDLTFRKLSDFNGLEEYYLVQFSEDKKAEEDALVIQQESLDDIARQRIEDLENELNRARVDLQNMVEELETSNEELQSSNEELMASNEELQSTNEELQSVNEELYTVNSELQEKNKELLILNDDMVNFLGSTDIGTLFLDLNLCIRKFTPALTKHFELHESDIGRSILSFASNFNEDTRNEMIADTKRSLKSMDTIEKEITDLDGNFFLRKVSPFISGSNQVEGIVISFIDVAKIKELEIERKRSERQYKNLFENMNEGFAHAKIITDNTGKPIDWEYIAINKAFEKQIGLKREQVIGRRVSEVFPIVKDDPTNWIKKYGQTALTGVEQHFEDYSLHLGGFFVVHVFCPDKGEFAATFSNQSNTKKAEEELKEANEQLNLAVQLAEIGIWEYDVLTDTSSGNSFWHEMFGFSKNDIIKQWNLNMHENDAEETIQQFNDYLEGKKDSYNAEFRYIHPKTKQQRWVKSVGKIMEWDGKGEEPIKMLGASYDITNFKTTLDNLERERLYISRLNQIVPCGIYIFDVRKNVFSFINKTYTNILGYTLEELIEFNKKEFNSLYHEDDREKVVAHTNKVISGETQQRIEYRLKHKKGHYVWCLSFDSPFETDGQGNVISFIGAFVTIDETKALE